MRPRSDTFVIEEWERIFRQFSRYEDWLGENPTDDRETLVAVYHPDGPRFEDMREGARNLVREGVTVSNSGPGSLLFLGRLSELDDIDDDRVRVLATTRSTGGVFRDRDGHIIERTDGWDRLDWDIDFRRTRDGRWLVWEMEVASG
jgi:hypothetical protein